MTLEALIEQLHAEGRLRVWSLVVTIFGDAVAPRGGSIAMTDLSELLERLGAEPGAIRTAMSRLARDGWVERDRVGRKSYYRLAEPRAVETEAAAARIYAAAPPDWDGSWTIAVTETALSGDEAPGLRKVAPHVWLAPGRADAPEGAFVIHGTGEAPEWARAQLSPAPLAERYAGFAATYGALELGALADPLDAMAARTLMIHDWRRILFRDAPLPRALRPRDWPGAAARETAARVYRALGPASERWLDARQAAPGAPLPRPGAGYAARFADAAGC